MDSYETRSRSAQPAVDGSDSRLPDKSDGLPQAPSEADGSSSNVAAPALATVIPIVTAACGGESSVPNQVVGGVTPTPTAGESPTSAPTPDPTSGRPSSEQAKAARFLLHVSLDARTEDIEDVLTHGEEAWLNRKIALPNAESAADFYHRLGFDKVDGNRYFDRNGSTDQMIWSQLLSGDNGVRKRWALALSEFFVVSATNLATRWSSTAMGNYWDLLNKFAFGNFRDLLEEITLCPAMAVFLDTKGNQKADPVTGREPDENFAREILQLFSIGLEQLNPDGTPRLENGNAVESYDNQDITGLAKCFTGYDFDFDGVQVVPHPNNSAWSVEEAGFTSQRITADPSRWQTSRTEALHSIAEKRFLGLTIPQGTSAETTLKATLDSIFSHPNVGPFFARQMIQRLVTSNPNPSYVQRVADIFNDNGRGVRGDLKAVFRAVVLDDSARNEAKLSDPEFGKVREPMVRFIQWARTFEASSESGTWELGPVDRQYDQLSQSPLRPPSVFGFFRPTFVPQGSKSAERSMVAPELQLVNETSAVGYLNFMHDMVIGHGYSSRDVKVNYAEEIPLAHDPQVLINHLDLRLTAAQMHPSTRQAIADAVASIPISEASESNDRELRVQTAVLLVMASPDYVIQR